MKLRFRKSNIWFYFVMIAFLEPALFTQFSMIDDIFLLLKVFASLYVLYNLFRTGREHGISKVQLVIVLFFGSLVLTTAINSGDIFRALSTVFFSIMACIYLDYCVRKYKEKCISLLLDIFVAFMTINFILLVLFPSGFGAYVPDYSMSVDSRLNFLGKDNAFIYFFLLAIVLAFLNNNKKKLYYVLSITLLTMLYVFSGTGLIGCGLIVFYAVFIQGKKIEKVFSFWRLSIIYIVIYYGIVILRIQEVFTYFIVSVLEKDITFTGRTYLWDRAFEYILQKPWLGYGISDNFLVAASGIAYSPHNLMLQILLAGGAISLVIFLILYFMSGSKLKYKKYRFSNILGVAIFAYLVSSLTEATMNTLYLYYLLILAYYIDIVGNATNRIPRRTRT